MEEEREARAPGEEGPGPREVIGIGGTPEGAAGRPAPGWRGWAISIVAAVILAVAATLLLGGSFSLRPGPAASSDGCRAGGNCCSHPPDK